MELSLDCAEFVGQWEGRKFVGSGDGGGPSHDNARGAGKIAAPAGGFVAAGLVFRAAAGVAAGVPEAGVVQEEQ